MSNGNQFDNRFSNGAVQQHHLENSDQQQYADKLFPFVQQTEGLPQQQAVFGDPIANRISGSSGMSAFTNTLHMGAQGYQSECNSNRPSESNYSQANNYNNTNNVYNSSVPATPNHGLNRESFQQQNQGFGPPRELFEDDIEDKEADTTIITTTSTSCLPFASKTVKDFFRSTVSPKKNRRSGSMKVKYNLKLSIQYETQHGEYLAVVGNIDELGHWSNFNKCQLIWTEGHNWVTENLIITSRSFFLYKYVVMEDGQPKFWEKGANRIADLEVLPDINKDIGKSSTHQLMTPGHTRLQKQKSISPEKNTLKHVQIIDEWEHFKIRFSINNPISEDTKSHGGDFMRIIGSTPKLGSQDVGEMERTPPMRMSRSQRPFEWLFDKYGQLERPWEIIINFRNGELEFPKEINYDYSKSNESGTNILKERDPSRFMVIQKPDTYNGELGKQGSNQWKNSQCVWIVNGVIDKADGNFLGGLCFDEIGDTKLFIGTYPLCEEDIQKMRSVGITGVLNLQTDNDILQRNIPWKHLKTVYQQCDIRSFRFPLSDNNEDEYCANLFMVAQHLNNMINNMGLTVYIHCSSGISRAPSVILVYLCLFKRVKQWQNPYYVAQFVKSFHLNSCPNMRAVQRVVEANLEFQRQQVDINNKTPISQEPVSGVGQSDEGKEPEFYFPQMMEGMEKKKPARNTVSYMKPRSAYMKKEYYRSQMDQNKYDHRSVTPLVPNQSKKPLLMDNIENAQMTTDDEKLYLAPKRQPFTQDDPSQTNSSRFDSQKPNAIGQDKFENAQPVISESVTVQDGMDQFKSMVLPDEKPLVQQTTPEKIFKSAQPKNFEDDQIIQKDDLQKSEQKIEIQTGDDQLTSKNDNDAINKIDDASPISNFKPDLGFDLKTPQGDSGIIDFGFKQSEPKKSEEPSKVLDFGFQLIQPEEKQPESSQEDQKYKVKSSPPPAPQPEDNQDEKEKPPIVEPVPMIEQPLDQLIEPENAVVAVKSKVKPENHFKVDYQNINSPLNDNQIIEPNTRLHMDSVAGSATNDDDEGLYQMQTNFRVQKAARLREFKRKRDSVSREKSFLRNSNQKIQQSLEFNKIMNDNLLFDNDQQNQSPQTTQQILKEEQMEKQGTSPANRQEQDKLLDDIMNQQADVQPAIQQSNHQPFDIIGNSVTNQQTSQRVANHAQANDQGYQPSNNSANKSAVRPYTKSAQRRRQGAQNESAERNITIRRGDNYSTTNSNDSPSQRFSHFDQIKRNYNERRQNDDLVRYQQLSAQHNSTNLALTSYVTTELIDKEASRQIRQVFHQEVARLHEERLIAERRAREEAENEIARLREENLKAKNRTIEIERLAREEAEKEIARLKREKLERQQNEMRRKQKLAEDRAERQRLMKLAEEMEQEKRRLKQIQDENEAERQRIQKEADQLKQQEDQYQRNQSLMLMQQAEEEEIERQKLQKIAKDKEERMKLQKKYEEEQQQKRQQILELTMQQKKLEAERKAREDTEEMLRKESIKRAQQELEELQKQRQQEEERLKKIKRDISIEEENQRSIRLSQQSPQKSFYLQQKDYSKVNESRNDYYSKAEITDKEIVQISEKVLEESPLLDKNELHSKPLTGNKSKVNVYYEVRSSNEGTNDNGQNKSFEHQPNSANVKKETGSGLKVRNMSLNKVDSPHIEEEKSLQTTRTLPKHNFSGFKLKEEPAQVQYDDEKEKPSNNFNDPTDEDLEAQCDKIFGKEAPLKFKCRPGNKIEETLQRLINKLNIRVPIIHIRAGVYLVGSSKVNLEQKFNHVMVRVGGGTERFDQYMPKHHRKFEKQLVQYMQLSETDLKSVVDKIVTGQKIKKNLTSVKKEEEPVDYRKRNRSGVGIKRVQVKLHGDMSSNHGSLYSKRTKEHLIDRDKLQRDLSTSEHSTSQGGHFLNKSIVDSINKSQLARGYSPIAMRGEIKLTFENQTNQSHINQSRISSSIKNTPGMYNPQKTGGTPKYQQLYDHQGGSGGGSSGIIKEEPMNYRGINPKTSKFQAEVSPGIVIEPPKTSRKYKHTINTYAAISSSSPNSGQRSIHHLGPASSSIRNRNHLNNPNPTQAYAFKSALQSSNIPKFQ